jgi:hypothetical protein
MFIASIGPQSPSSIIWGWYNRPVVAAVPSGLSLTPLRIKNKYFCILTDIYLYRSLIYNDFKERRSRKLLPELFRSLHRIKTFTMALCIGCPFTPGL